MTRLLREALLGRREGRKRRYPHRLSWVSAPQPIIQEQAKKVLFLTATQQSKKNEITKSRRLKRGKTEESTSLSIKVKT